ncbi:magnesium-translocating P-type ATPase [Streptomyces formicae]|uniref:Magnesium-transporting ATPase, P-type 1 n=1 Tax=Streptomyces formicae TaxID=1616117 RepID=A0A291QIV2_9ACTN|nr:Mg(2+) transport ATPase, P-type [Streptomyces formicae]
MPERLAPRAARKNPLPGAGPGDLTPLHVLRSLDTTPRGLTEQDATDRLALHGPNTLPAHRTVSWPVRLLRSLRDPFTAVLLVLGLVSAAVASWGTACVILTLVAVSCVLRSHGEHRAENAVRHLRDLVASTATVRRRDTADAEPRTRETPVDELVPGDVIRLGPGDLVPADVRLLRAHGLTVDQSALTGESAPVAKAASDPPGPDAVAADGAFTPPHLCFQGSSVASGSAAAVVVATGADTRFAAAHTGPGPRASTAFDRSVHGISWVLIRFMLITPPLVLMANAALRGRGLETLPFAVAVAVGLTPEMLPVIVTTCLARGAALLARTHGVIVRRLPALHDLGAVDVLCVDKTGTLTQDRPEVAGAYDAAGRHAPDVLGWAAANAWWTLQLADLPAPDALDEALLDAVDPEEAMAYDGVAALPFTPERRVSTAVVRTPGALGGHTLIVKGAVESVVERCALSDGERAEVLATAGRRAEAGLRVIAVATAERPARTGAYTPAVERGLTLRGLVAFRDALAPGAEHALAGLAERGVTVKVLTGDHPATAARACRDLGLDPGEVVGADRIDALADEELAALAATTTVFARCTPEHKARITAALRGHGHTTGFLGDGVNDLPALRAADVGICPRGGVEVARESADVVLADKDLTAIGHAIAAGRLSSGNIATYLRITLSSNLGNVIAMLAAGLLLPFLPMLPVQVLVQNLCFDAAQLAFAHDRPAPATTRRPTVLRPRSFLRFITGFGLLGALADLATFGALALTAGAWGDAAAFHSGWFTENLLAQALVILLLRTGPRPAPGPLRAAAAALAAIGVLLPLTPLGGPLGLTSLPLPYYGLLAGILAVYALVLVGVRRAQP